MKKQLLLSVAALSLFAANVYAAEDPATAPGASDAPATASADQGTQKTTHKHHHHKSKKKKSSKAKEQESNAQESGEQGGEPAPVGALREGR